MISEPGDYDRAARLAITTEPEGFLRGLPPEVAFTRWLETRTTPLPGEQDRICDTIAELNHRDGLGVPWALIVEAQTRPASDFTEQALTCCGSASSSDTAHTTATGSTSAWPWSC